MKKLSSILIIDDDPTTGFLHRRLIEKFGVSEKVNNAYGGEEALQLIHDCSQTQSKGKIPQLIFVDLNMPFMNGFEFLDAYQNLEFENKGSVVVYMLSSSCLQKDVNRVKEYPVVSGYVIKPLTEEKVIELMQKHFGWNSLSA